MSKNKKKRVFNAKWREERDFKSWLTSCKTEEKARCRICKNFLIWTEKHLESHCHGKKHKENDVKTKSFFQPLNKSLVKLVKGYENETVRVVVQPTSSRVEQPTSSRTQATFELVVRNSEKTRAEILWALNSVSSGYSNNSCSNIYKLFQSIFFDSKIVNSFQMGLTKQIFCKLRNSSIF